MIVVAGRLGSGAAGRASAATVATRIAALGEAVEVVAVVPGDAAGDRRLLELHAAGVGHAAVLRSPAPDLDPADLELALRYLPDVRAIALIEPASGLAATAAQAAGWSGAPLIVVARPGDDVPDDLDARTIMLAAPDRDPDGAFAGFVASLAVELAAGAAPADAWAATTAALGVDAVSPASGS